MPDDHSILAPSSASRWTKCPGSIKMQQDYPQPEKDQTAADEGTAAHEALEHLIAGYGHPRDLIGETASNGFVFDAEMVAGAQVMADDIRKVRVAGGGLNAHVEDRTHANQLHSQIWGTVDCWVWDEPNKTVYIWDFKYGRRYVPVIENRQLLCYLAGVLVRLNIHGAFNVVMKIVQPRTFTPDSPIREWKLSSSDLEPYFEELKVAAHTALGENPTLRAGSHCRYCTRLVSCPTAIEAGQSLFDAVQNVAVDHKKPADFGKYLDLLTQASEMVELLKTAAEAEAEAMLKSSTPIPGWELQPGQSSRKWSVDEKAVLEMGKGFGIELQNQKPITPKQAEDAGIDPAIVSAFSKTHEGSLKLKKSKNLAKYKFND